MRQTSIITCNSPPIYHKSQPRSNPKIKNINPSKQTYLLSNRMVSNNLYQKIKRQQNNLGDPKMNLNSYDCCKVQLQKFKINNAQKLNKIQKIHKKAQATLRMHNLQQQENKNNNKNNAKLIIKEKKELEEKVYHLLSKGLNSSYLGRASIETIAMLKDINQKNGDIKLRKLESLKRIMKDFAKNIEIPNIIIPQNLKDSIFDSSAQNNSTMNNSNASSIYSQDNGVTTNNKINRQEQIIYQQICNIGYQKTREQVKRRAVWNSFIQYWNIKSIPTKNIQKKKFIKIQNNQNRISKNIESTCLSLKQKMNIFKEVGQNYGLICREL